jgi:ribosomal protein L37E
MPIFPQLCPKCGKRYYAYDIGQTQCASCSVKSPTKRDCERLAKLRKHWTHEMGEEALRKMFPDIYARHLAEKASNGNGRT